MTVVFLSVPPFIRMTVCHSSHGGIPYFVGSNTLKIIFYPMFKTRIILIDIHAMLPPRNNWGWGNCRAWVRSLTCSFFRQNWFHFQGWLRLSYVAPHIPQIWNRIYAGIALKSSKPQTESIYFPFIFCSQYLPYTYHLLVAHDSPKPIRLNSISIDSSSNSNRMPRIRPSNVRLSVM